MSILDTRYKDINYCVRCGSKLAMAQDREGKTRPHCSSCGWIFYKNPIPVVCCLIINDKDEIVIIKRKFPPAAGSWALPSGYMEIDQTPETAAIAEMKEETNLDGEPIRCVGYRMSPNPFYEKVLSIGFSMRIVGGELQAGDDAAEAKYVPLAMVGKLPFESQNFFLEEELRRRETDKTEQ